MVQVNFWAILASAIVSMVIGSIWYGPLFGKMFREAMGMNQWSPEKQAAMKKTMGMSYALQFIASLVMFFILSMFITKLGQWSMVGGLVVAFWSWLGFVVPIKLADALWGGKMVMFWLSISNMLLTLLVAGAIIGAWR